MNRLRRAMRGSTPLESLATMWPTSGAWSQQDRRCGQLTTDVAAFTPQCYLLVLEMSWSQRSACANAKDYDPRRQGISLSAKDSPFPRQRPREQRQGATSLAAAAGPLEIECVVLMAGNASRLELTLNGKAGQPKITSLIPTPCMRQELRSYRLSPNKSEDVADWTLCITLSRVARFACTLRAMPAVLTLVVACKLGGPEIPCASVVAGKAGTSPVCTK